MKFKSFIGLGVAIALLSTGLSVHAADESCAPFSDVDAGTVYCLSIDYLKNQHIVSGYSDNTYRPYQEIGRAEFTKIIIGAIFDTTTIDSCMQGVTDEFFTDTSNSEWYAKYLCVAKEQNIIAGYEDGSFKPGNSIVLSEASKIILNTFGLSMDSIDSDPWYKRYVDGLAYAKAIPVSLKRFDQNINRAEMAEMVTRLRTTDFAQNSQDYPTLNSISNPEENTTKYSAYIISSTDVEGTVEGYLFNDVFDFVISLKGKSDLKLEAQLSDGTGKNLPITMTYDDSSAHWRGHGTWNDLSSDSMEALKGGDFQFEANEKTIIGTLTQDNNIFTDFAIYDPAKEDDGVWEEDVTALKAILDEFGYTYTVVDAEDINKGRLFNEEGGYKSILMPGGWAYTRSLRINTDGKEHLQDFLKQGGNYVGFCAGAYFAAGTIEFATEATGGGGIYAQESDYIDYSEYYNNDLLTTGSIKGPFGWFPWADGANLNYELAHINTNNQTMKTIGLPESTRFLYGGGPFFEIELSQEPEGYEVWVYAQKPDGPSNEASIGDGKPAVIRYHYGEGNVILFSYHPEVLIGSDRDNIDSLTQYYQEDSIDWNRGDQSQDDINIDNWNIVHAAVQIGANEMPTPMGK